MSGRRHDAVLIASSGTRGDKDLWFWCSKCGALSCNKKEWWKAGGDLDKEITKLHGALPPGAKRVECLP